MSKLSLNLTKINEKKPKLAIERFFLGAEYWTGEECRGRKKRMDSNNIHLWFNYPPRLDPKDMKPHVPLVPKVKLGHTNRVDIRTAFGQYWSFAHFPGGVPQHLF